MTIIDAEQSGSLRIGEFWSHRELFWFFMWRQLKIRYKQTVIGIAWAVIQPVGTMLVFTLFFGKLASLPADGLPYPVFYYSALVPWAYFAQSVQNSTNALVENQQLITKIYFPRLMLPISTVTAGLVDFAFAFLVLVGILFYFGFALTASALWLPAFLMLAILGASAVGIWTSALNALYRDVRYALPFMIQFWLFLSPIAYPSSLVPVRFRWLYYLNPMAGVVDGFRWTLTGAARPPTHLVLISAAVVLGMLIGGVFFFQRIQSTIADRI